LRIALERAGPELRDAALLAACARAGVGSDFEPAPIAPFRDRVHRLGLDRPAAVVAEASDRRWLLTENEPLPERFELTISVDRGSVLSARGGVRVPRQRLLLLEHIARAGQEGASMEQMVRTVWGYPRYHPLRHRNTIYVAITRLRQSLRRLIDDDVLVEIAEGRYRLETTTVVVRRAPYAGSTEHPPPPQ
jgi:DNA-binding winged helix-turn-helix (wHTH) protein